MGETLAVIVVAGGLVAGSFYLHYSILRLSSRLASNRGMPTRRPLLLVLSLVFCAHLLEVFLFALAYYAMHWSAWMGALAGGSTGGSEDFVRYFYFSISSYTTLGAGDIAPVGLLRIVAGIEALTGLVLIAWSASFSFLMMERLWNASDGK